MASAAQVAQFRAANQALTAQVEADLDDFVRRLDLSRPERALNALLNFVPLLTQRYGEIAAAIAADWYEELRADALEVGFLASLGGARSFTASPGAPVAAEVSRRAVESARPLLQETSPDAFLSRLKGNTTRHVLQAGRDTVTRNTRRDRAARGWARAVRPGGCKFCQMLAGRSRGGTVGVYTEASSRFAAHDHCNCVSYPVFDPDAPKIDVNAEFVASARTSAMTPEQRDEFRSRVASYLEAVPDEVDAALVYLD